MHRPITAAVMSSLAAIAAIPASSAWAARPAHLAKAGATPTATATTKPVKIKGPVEQMQWGAVQAVITVKNKKITKVHISAPMERSRSAFINQQAIPLLTQETLKLQKPKKLELVSGATMTSEAYIQSLKSAVKKAKTEHLL